MLARATFIGAHFVLLRSYGRGSALEMGIFVLVRAIVAALMISVFQNARPKTYHGKPISNANALSLRK